MINLITPKLIISVFNITLLNSLLSKIIVIKYKDARFSKINSELANDNK